jgi:methylaspartate mutase sigma subunit
MSEPIALAPRVPPPARRLSLVIAGLSSDAHTWNLVFVQLVLEELGHDVRNLGACVPDEVILDACRKYRPDLLLVGSINGHGVHDGKSLIRAIRATPELALMPVGIGGMLSTGGADHSAELLAAGFDAVFEEHGNEIDLRAYADSLCRRCP